ncbi:mediator of RNA polymerase II transcription subunit 22-like [Saccostrea cucullata]|uniref:mediator of RNA polymerase II transcription subunit 22-like n=1 Tax=Saccostrea echinata TaxID=191078 RepID=UPI002A81E7F7|nr:mediator of RNA polymerase II transcription subunit 22-like [Saccostrea echinata]
MSQARSLPQSKEALLKSYNKKLKDNIQSMLVNFEEIIKLARMDEDSQISKYTQTEEDQYEMQVRAANIVRAGESLMKSVSDLKQFMILNDFPSVNESIIRNAKNCKSLQQDLDNKLTSLRDEMAIDLFELEDEYYSSAFK